MRGSAETRDLLILNGKLVVISDLLSTTDVPLRVYHNLFLGAYSDDFGVTVWL